MMLICRLLPLLLLAAWLPGQEDRLSEREAEMERRIKERMERGGEKDAQFEKELSGEAEEQALQSLTPEERLARNVRSNASAFCRFVAAIKPQKLMPGQSGVMVVSALLNGQAVLPSPPPMEMIGARQHGIVSLGELSFHPADLGRHAAGYAGRPVYDNYAVFEIPISVAADATIGTKQPVSIDLRFDIYDGVSAQPIGRFVDRVTTEVEVGKALDPAVAGGRGRPVVAGAGASAAGESPRPAGATPGPVGTAEERIIVAQDPHVVAPIAPPEVGTAPVPPAEANPLSVADDGSILPLPVWIGVGGLLLALVLLLARKK